MTNLDKYLDPPDEPEAQYCDGCGEEMEEVPAMYRAGMPHMKCPNKYCPDKHTGVARGIAIELADARATIEELKREIFVLRINFPR